MIFKEIPIKFILVLLATKPNTPCTLLASCSCWKTEFSKASAFISELWAAQGPVPLLQPVWGLCLSPEMLLRGPSELPGEPKGVPLNPSWFGGKQRSQTGAQKCVQIGFPHLEAGKSRVCLVLSAPSVMFDGAPGKSPVPCSSWNSLGSTTIPPTPPSFPGGWEAPAPALLLPVPAPHCWALWNPRALQRLGMVREGSQSISNLPALLLLAPQRAAAGGRWLFLDSFLICAANSCLEKPSRGRGLKNTH